MPTDSMCSVACDGGEKYSVPVVLDVRDFWSDIFRDLLPGLGRLLVSAFSRKMLKSVCKSFRRANAVVGNKDAFVDWGLRKANRARTIFDRAFPIGSSIASNLSYNHSLSRQFWKKYRLEADDGCFNFFWERLVKCITLR